MKKLITILFSLCLSVAAFSQVSLGLGYQPGVLNQEVLYADIEGSWRVDVDRDIPIHKSDIAFLVGARYGVATSTVESSFYETAEDYLFVLARGYFDLDLWNWKGIATMEYDIINDRFFLGPGLYVPFSKSLSLEVQSMIIPPGKIETLDYHTSVRIGIKMRIGK